MPPRHRHLPAPVWGAILDYLIYHEVRSALLINRTIANEAVKYVQVLNITSAFQMYVPAARRFSNVEEVNILCLLAARPSVAEYFGYDLSRNAAVRIVPFLTGFPALKKAFVGGLSLNNTERVEYDRHDRLTRPDDHLTLFRNLVDTFRGASAAGTLPKSLQTLRGISNRLAQVRDCYAENPDRPCRFCRDVCAHFPLTDVLRVSVCLSDYDRYKLLTERPGGRECLQSAMPDRMIDVLNKATNFFPLRKKDGTGDEKARFNMLQRQGVMRGDNFVLVQHIPKDKLIELDSLVEFGFVPRHVPREDLYTGLRIASPERKYDVWAKSTFDELVSRGFRLDAADLVIVDETKDPALHALAASIHEEDASST